MTDERQTDATAGTGQPTGEPVVSSGGMSVEEVEAFWRNRQSGQDRAHNAEVASLKEQMAALQRPPDQAPVGESPEAARIRELQTELAAANAAREAEVLKSRYPMAASILGDAITNIPVEKLAAAEAALDTGGVAPMVEPNMAGRNNSAVQGPTAKPLGEKTKDELLADLKRAEPVIQAEAREGIYR